MPGLAQANYIFYIQLVLSNLRVRQDTTQQNKTTHGRASQHLNHKPQSQPHSHSHGTITITGGFIMEIMKKHLLGAVFCILLLLGMMPSMAFAADDSVAINDTNFPDSGFRGYVEKNCDTNKDGKLSADEIANVTSIVSFFWSPNKVSSLKGIEYFTSLQTLYCSGDNLTELDLTNNTELKSLTCSSNKLTTLNVSGLNALQSIDCKENSLTSLDLSGCKNINIIYCENNQLTSLNLKGCKSLASLSCENNQLTALDLSDCKDINAIYCQNNQLASLNLDGCTSFEVLNCGNNKLTSLDVSNNKILKLIAGEDNQLTSLNFEGCDSLLIIQCENNQLTSLDLSTNKKLTTLWCYNNHLTSLDTNQNNALETLLADYYLDNNKNKVLSPNTYEITVPAKDRTFDLSKLPGTFAVEKASNWQGGTVDGTILTVNQDAEEVTYTYDCGNEETANFVLKVSIKDDAENGGSSVGPGTTTPAGSDTAKSDNAVSTGDNSPLALYAILLLASLAAGSAVLLYRKRVR